MIDNYQKLFINDHVTSTEDAHSVEIDPAGCWILGWIGRMSNEAW